MREIKFRVWDNNSELMYHEGIKISGDGVFRVYDVVNDIFAQNNDNAGSELMLMQYIGFKDISGQEIYEGDIIDGYLISPRVPTRGVIVYDKEHLFWGSKNLGGITALFKIKDIKIIGNKYDNPELINYENN